MVAFVFGRSEYVPWTEKMFFCDVSFCIV
jgi:hypothetical protein